MTTLRTQKATTSIFFTSTSYQHRSHSRSMLHRTPAIFYDGFSYPTLGGERICSRLRDTAGSASTVTLSASLAATTRMSRILHLLRYHKIWNRRLAEARQFGNLKAGQHPPLRLFPSRLPWTPWKSARDKEMPREGLYKSSMWLPTQRIREASRVPFLHSKQLCLSLARAGRVPDRRPKVPWRSFRLLSVNRSLAKRSVRKQCRRRHVLVAIKAEQCRRMRSHLNRLQADPPPAVRSHLAETRTVNQPLRHPPQKPPKDISLDQSPDLATSFPAQYHPRQPLDRHLSKA
jgi:hypothetical protein